MTLTNKDCRSRSASNVVRKITNTTICAFSQRGQGACRGDSGSPLATTNGTLIGIVSWIVPCARGVPDGYARISVFVKWIQKVSGVVAK